MAISPGLRFTIFLKEINFHHIKVAKKTLSSDTETICVASVRAHLTDPFRRNVNSRYETGEPLCNHSAEFFDEEYKDLYSFQLCFDKFKRGKYYNKNKFPLSTQR